MPKTVIPGRGQPKENQPAGATVSKTRVEQAEARTAQAETRTEQAKTRTELAETRTEQAETRTEQAETRTELAKTRTEQAETRSELAELRSGQAETALQRVINKQPSLQSLATPLDKLTARQRDILQLIAGGQNTKQIAEALNVSPKTIEYHRKKLMVSLNIHDVPGLVRFAFQAGLLPPDKLGTS